eukprot:8049758-Alexandrium_andersonii.AAC.1
MMVALAFARMHGQQSNVVAGRAGARPGCECDEHGGEGDGALKDGWVVTQPICQSYVGERILRRSGGAGRLLGPLIGTPLAARS